MGKNARERKAKQEAKQAAELKEIIMFRMRKQVEAKKALYEKIKAAAERAEVEEAALQEKVGRLDTGAYPVKSAFEKPPLEDGDWVSLLRPRFE